MRAFVTPHCHQSSLDTGSTPKEFLARELELGTGYTTVTDHGTLQAAREVYDLAKEKGVTPIIGLEAYFRDDDCPILRAAGIPKGPRYVNRETGALKKTEDWAKLTDKDKLKFETQYGFWNYWKYAHLTMHALDAEAYETLVKILSAADARAERHGSERKPLFAWKELEELGSKNITFGSGCLIGMVQRHLLGSGKGFLAGDAPHIALKYYDRLRSIVKPGNFLVEVFPHVCTHNWESKVIIDYQDGTQEAFPEWKGLKTNDGPVKARDLAKIWGTKACHHETVFEVMENRAWVQREGRVIKGVRHEEGFVQNECRPWCPDGDVQEGCNRMMLDLAGMYGDPVVISDDSHYAHPDEKVVQNVRLSSQGWGPFFGQYHRQSTEESLVYFRDVMGQSVADVEKWVDNSHAWAERFKGFTFNQRLSLPTKFYPGSTLERAFGLIKKHGRMAWNDPKYVERLDSEIQLLHKNGTVDLLPYFFVAEEVCSEYEKRSLLTGPGRGSAAGLLFSYLLGITHVDPLKYGLSQERFLTLDRIEGGKLPDIDQDLPNRDFLTDPETGWLKQRFGDHYVQISTDTKLKLRSSVKDVMRARVKELKLEDQQKTMNEIEGMTKKFLQAPQGIEDFDFVHGYKDADDVMQKGSIEYDKALQEFIRRYPEEWETVNKCLGLARQKSRHACGYVICNEPVSDFIPTTSVGDVTVTQYTAKSVEAVGGLKMDYLVVNSLNDIGDCVKLIQEMAGPQPGDWCMKDGKHTSVCSAHMFPLPDDNMTIDGRRVPWFRVVPFEGILYDIWDLPQHQPVFRDICEGKTETVFQFNTESAKKWFKYFNKVRFTDVDGEVHKSLDTDEALSAFTALDRPGPLDAMVTECGTTFAGGLVPDTVNDNAGVGWVPPRNGLRPEVRGHNMLVEYARRAAGEAPMGNIKALDRMLPETYGVIVYQEQLQKIFQVVGHTTALQADAFRVHISKKQMEKVYKDKSIFMPGAIQELGEAEATRLWDSMETFGKYGFNKSHAVCYAAKIGYACAWLKHWYPLQWWTSVLRNADKNEVNEAFWPYCGQLVLMPNISKSKARFHIEGDHIRAPLNLLGGIGPEAHKQLLAGLPYKDIQDFSDKIQAHRVATGTIVEVVNEKTKKVTRKLKGGRSALTRKVVYTLIQSGAMDNLFPETLDMLSQLDAYEQALAIATKKKAAKVDFERYGKINQLCRYQMQKAVLPAYSQDVVPAFLDMKVKDIYERPWTNVEGRETKHGFITYKRWDREGNLYGTEVAFVDGLTFRMLNIDEEYPQNALVAVAGYVKGVRKFAYGSNKEKKALEVIIDINGFDFKLVRWPGRDGHLDSKFNESSLRGAIVVVVATKFDPKRPFSIEDIRVIQDPLDLTSEESSAKEIPDGQTAVEATQALAN